MSVIFVRVVDRHYQNKLGHSLKSLKRRKKSSFRKFCFAKDADYFTFERLVTIILPLEMKSQFHIIFGHAGPLRAYKANM